MQPDSHHVAKVNDLRAGAITDFGQGLFEWPPPSATALKLDRALPSSTIPLAGTIPQLAQRKR